MTIRTLTAVVPAVCVSAVLLTAASRTSDDAPTSHATPGASTTVSAGLSPSAATQGRLPLAFEANRGQVDAEADYLARRGPVTTYFTHDSIVVQAERRDDEGRVSGAAVRLAFEGCTPTAAAPEAPLAGRVNYFRGEDPSGWITDVPTYGGLRYRDLYPGVDVEVGDGGGVVEYNLVVRPGADLAQVVVRVDGVDGLELVDGALRAKTRNGDLVQYIPKTWETSADGATRVLAANFRLVDERRFGFDVPDRDPSAELVVDPLLVFSTFLGGSGLEEIHGLATSSDGFIFVTGRSSSSSYPRTAGCYDNVLNGSYDCVVTKLNQAGTALVFSSFLGSNGTDLAEEIVVTPAGEAIVSGWIGGSGFPTTAGAYDTSYNGFSDTFVTKFAVSGNSLVYSTFVGGSNEDRPQGLALCPDGGVVVVGQTQSTNFPIVAGAQDASHNGNWDGYVFKLSAAGTSAVFSTYLGGSGIDFAYGVAVPPDGAPIVVGATTSPTFPMVGTPLDATHNGGFDAWVVKFSPGSGAAAWSTFLGGPGADHALSVDTDADGAAYLTGASGFGFPSTPGAFDTAHDGGECFLTKIAPGGGAIEFSTFFGGTSTDQGNVVRVDVLKAPYVVGWTNSSNLPISAITYDASFNGGGSPAEGFVAKFDSTGGELLFSSYIGSPNNDDCRGLSLDAAGSAYIGGITLGAMDMPGAGFDLTANGQDDGFVVKLDLSPAALVATLGPGCNVGSSAPVVDCNAPVLGQTATANGSGAPISAFGAVLIGSVPANNSFLGYGCVLQMSTVDITALEYLYSEPDGSWTVSTPVAPIPANAGTVIRVQGVFLSPSHPLGLVLTNALEVTLGY